MVEELDQIEIDSIDGGKLSAGEVTAYTLIGVAAVCTGGFGAVVAGTFLLSMTAVLA